MRLQHCGCGFVWLKTENYTMPYSHQSLNMFKSCLFKHALKLFSSWKLFTGNCGLCIQTHTIHVHARPLLRPQRAEPMFIGVPWVKPRLTVGWGQSVWGLEGGNWLHVATCLSPWPSLAVLLFARMWGLLLYSCGWDVVAKCTVLFVSFGTSVDIKQKLREEKFILAYFRACETGSYSTAQR